jgi:hypothetical protein
VTIGPWGGLAFDRPGVTGAVGIRGAHSPVAWRNTPHPSVRDSDSAVSKSCSKFFLSPILRSESSPSEPATHPAGIGLGRGPSREGSQDSEFFGHVGFGLLIAAAPMSVNWCSAPRAAARGLEMLPVGLRSRIDALPPPRV